MIKNSFEVRLAYHVRSDSEQDFMLATVYFNLTRKQMINSLELLIKDLTTKLGAEITMLDVRDYRSKQPTDLYLYLSKYYPAPVRSTDELKRNAERYHQYHKMD